MTLKRARWILSAIAIIGIAVHLKWPSFGIDGITLVLLGVLVVPWIGPAFKSLEFPGGWKVEFHDLQKAGQDIANAGLRATGPQAAGAPEYAFQSIASSDPNLALAGLRIEIEKRLVKLAQSRGLEIGRTGLGRLLQELNVRQLINGRERSVLTELINLLNSAVHGAIVDSTALNWAMDVGPGMLAAIDERAANHEFRYDGIA